ALRQQLQGGSTITQQLVKSALLSPERTIQRKIREVFLAFLVEKKYSKNQILELYLNQVPYGGTSYGAASASHLFFGKSVRQISLAEAALLSGMPQAPTAYSPFGAHPELARQRQEQVLKRMLEDKHITKEQYEQALNEPLIYSPPSHKILAPHFSLYVRDQLVKKYSEDMVLRGGLKVTTTLDYELQKFAEQIFASESAALLKLKASNAAAVVTKPGTGEVLAMLGSIDYFATPSGNFNVTLAKRQPGSAFKPINYGVGLDSKKVTPATLFVDGPICYPSLTGQKNYCPQNYDGRWHGPVQLRFALGNSFNIPAVKMMKFNGVETVIATASAMGISTLTEKNRYGLSLTLGGGEVTMLDMAVAFGTFANAGARQDLITIAKVEDRFGKVLFVAPFFPASPAGGPSSPSSPFRSSLLISGPRVISPEAAYLISHILLDN
ncbi:MAG: transglycosylase domain-containing protein, partial [Patescibacteria group bacterium]